MTQQVLNNLKVGTNQKKGRIVAYELKRPDITKDERLFLTVDTYEGRRKPITVNEIWYTDYRGEAVSQSLRVDRDPNGNLRPVSLLYRFLKFMGANTFGDLVDKEVILEPKPANGFLCIVTQI